MVTSRWFDHISTFVYNSRYLNVVKDNHSLPQNGVARILALIFHQPSDASGNCQHKIHQTEAGVYRNHNAATLVGAILTAQQHQETARDQIKHRYRPAEATSRCAIEEITKFTTIKKKETKKQMMNNYMGVLWQL